MALSDELLDKILAECDDPQTDLLSKDVLVKQLTQRLIERAMDGELTHHLGYSKHSPTGKNSGNSNLHDARWDQAFHPKGRNKRTVWSIPLSKFREAHFAVFPETLVETCLQASCPDQGVVLDPFLGSGTTAVVAQRLGRRYVGIDCVTEYCAMAQRRIDESRV